MSTQTEERLAGVWQFDPVHSAATFTVKYLVAPFRSEFGEFTAELVDGQLKGSAPVSSLKVKNEDFAAHLAGPDFFDSERFPEVSFESRSIAADGDAVTVDGLLTLKGVTKEVRATGSVSGPAEDFMGNTRVGLSLSTTVDRNEFGVSWNAPLPKGGNALADEVKLEVALEFIAAE